MLTSGKYFYRLYDPKDRTTWEIDDMYDFEMIDDSIAAARAKSDQLAAQAKQLAANQLLAKQLAANQLLAKRLLSKQATRKQAAELAAQEKAAREAAELAAQEKAAREAAELAAAQEKAAREAAELAAAQEKAANEAAELAAQEKAANEAAELAAAQEKAAREAAELAAAQEKAANEAAELAAQEKAANEAAELAAAQEKAAREAAELAAAQEKAANEAAELVAREKEAREQEAREQEAREQAVREQEARAQAARELTSVAEQEKQLQVLQLAQSTVVDNANRLAFIVNDSESLLTRIKAVSATVTSVYSSVIDTDTKKKTVSTADVDKALVALKSESLNIRDRLGVHTKEVATLFRDGMQAVQSAKDVDISQSQSEAMDAVLQEIQAAGFSLENDHNKFDKVRGQIEEILLKMAAQEEALQRRLVLQNNVSDLFKAASTKVKDIFTEKLRIDVVDRLHNDSKKAWNKADVAEMKQVYDALNTKAVKSLYGFDPYRNPSEDKDVQSNARVYNSLLFLIEKGLQRDKVYVNSQLTRAPTRAPVS
jgi:hypothetical protein